MSEEYNMHPDFQPRQHSDIGSARHAEICQGMRNIETSILRMTSRFPGVGTIALGVALGLFLFQVIFVFMVFLFWLIVGFGAFAAYASR